MIPLFTCREELQLTPRSYQTSQTKARVLGKSHLNVAFQGDKGVIGYTDTCRTHPTLTVYKFLTLAIQKCNFIYFSCF